jgi:hypothetical protein
VQSTWAGSARRRGELALRHSELFEVGADLRLPLPADEPLGYGRIPGQPHRKFCFAQNSEAICGSLRGLVD